MAVARGRHVRKLGLYRRETLTRAEICSESWRELLQLAVFVLTAYVLVCWVSLRPTDWFATLFVGLRWCCSNATPRNRLLAVANAGLFALLYRASMHCLYREVCRAPTL